MIYPYIVVKNGKWYKSGENVPDDSENILKSGEKTNYTKTDIHRMPVEELRKLATEYGIENAEIMNGSEIKKIILNYLEM